MQVSGDLLVVGDLTEQRAMEIARWAAKDAIAMYSDEAAALADTRIDQFDLAMVRRLNRSGLLGALADPAVQVTMRKAQMGAASTERESDYELLASLIDDRAKRADERPVRASINKAVEIVDQIDSGALASLTLFYAVSQYRPMNSDPVQGIATMERLLGQLVPERDLESGVDWIEHLDTLGAVRISEIGSLSRFDAFWSDKTPGYISVGLESGSTDEADALAAIAELGVGLPLVEHQFKPGYKRLHFPFDASLELGMRNFRPNTTEEEMAAVLKVATDRCRMESIDEGARSLYMATVRASPVLGRIGGWWDSIEKPFSVTGVGKVLARANAQRLDAQELLPPLT